MISGMRRIKALFCGAVSRIVPRLRAKADRLSLRWHSLSVPARRAVMYCASAALLGVTYFSANLVVDGLETYWSRSAEITFELPFPADVERPFNLLGKSGMLDVRRVVLAGDFSGWNPDSDEYLMENVAPGKWRISVRLLPGNTSV